MHLDTHTHTLSLSLSLDPYGRLDSLSLSIYLASYLIILNFNESDSTSFIFNNDQLTICILYRQILLVRINIQDYGIANLGKIKPHMTRFRKKILSPYNTEASLLTERLRKARLSGQSSFYNPDTEFGINTWLQRASGFKFDNLSNFLFSFFSFFSYFYLVKIYFHGWSPSGIAANVLDSDMVVSKFEHKTRFYVHFWTNTPGKGMNTLILDRYGLNITTNVLLQVWFWK